jgi:hypothetical protein
MAALSVVLHAETSTRVEIERLGDHSVTLIVGDDRNGLRVIGDTDDVAQLVAEAHRLLQVARG